MSICFDLLSRTFSYRFPTKIVFGIGSISRLTEELKRFKFEKILMVSGPKVSRTEAYSVVRNFVESTGANLAEFTTTDAEPDVPLLNSLASIAREQRPEIVIGVGGGSSMDLSKLASALSVNGKDPISYFKGEPVPIKGPPIITIPTLAGTGSEVTPISVIVENGVKLALVDHNLFPSLALVDPSLSRGAGPEATASAGIDALCHAIESMMSVDSNPVSDALSTHAIELACSYLERAYCNGGDLEARAGISAASVLAGMAFQATGLCLPHGIAYTYAVKRSLPHGSSVSIAEPYVAIFNAPAIPGKISRIARAMGVDTYGLSASDIGLEVAFRILDITQTLSLPQTLEDLGIGEHEIEAMVDDLITNHRRFIIKNPRKPSRDELIDLYTDILEGI
ncbi:MAG: iron-containing alcohol dehydrogenase [Candidatus Verstraetearchaeota archaeon]|nr:iron-containing alcohol dehydrogenase [Candidatus Verstraetearchaeota archaeon]